MTDPLPRNKPPDARVYVSSNQAKVLALKRALWNAGYKVYTYPDKRSNDQDVTVLYHNATDDKFAEIRQSISF